MLERIKHTYIIWYGFYHKIPKTHRHSLGVKVDIEFTDIIEAVATAIFLSKSEKQPWVKLAIRKLETLKIFLLVLWETKSLETNKYIALSMPLEEVGKMLGGWNGQLTKQNSPASYGASEK